MAERTYWPLKKYQQTYERSLADPEGFWAEDARKLEWFRPWDRVLEWELPSPRWFVGGQLNASHLCVDTHAQSWRRRQLCGCRSQPLEDRDART